MAASKNDILIFGFPGLEAFHIWISILFFLLSTVVLLGNSMILLVVILEPNLHESMHYFLFMLSVTDLGLALSTMPMTLSVLWFNAREITLNACIIQLFFLHSSGFMESSVLMVMAFDCFVAICRPLRYATILTDSRILKIGVAIVLRMLIRLLWVSPFCFMVSRMPFCQHQAIPQSYCEHMAVLKLVCADTSINRGYGLFVAFSVAGFDMTVIGMSYMMILRALLQLPSGEARLKAFSTCASHICVILAFYIPALFSFLTHRFGHYVPQVVHILFANLYLLVPPMLNPIIYGVRTKQIRDRVTQGCCGNVP
uniref:G-protein coupled receptors family 1 profile domain-containing protein n=1 Tax=Piliocolobus tephrosceles TaxID=591936 RepID=A0A8C9H3V8_9PRIM